jgi:hypothetical protein
VRRHCQWHISKSGFNHLIINFDGLLVFDDYLIDCSVLEIHYSINFDDFFNYLTANYYEYLMLSDYLKATPVAEQVDS